VSGVGRNIALAAELMEPARMFAWIAVVIVTAMLLNGIVSLLENRMRRSA
jgi:ABC-type nitrate/sulfonate/bicarbonate transport system permease component